MKLTGWLVEEAARVPSEPKAWFRIRGEAVEYQKKHGGVIREMNGEVQRDALHHTPVVAEVLR